MVRKCILPIEIGDWFGIENLVLSTGTYCGIIHNGEMEIIDEYDGPTESLRAEDNGIKDRGDYLDHLHSIKGLVHYREETNLK